MKNRFVILITLFVGCLSANAQQEDTIKVKPSLNPSLHLKDSLLYYKNSLNGLLHPDYNLQEKRLSIFGGDSDTPSLSVSSRSRNVFSASYSKFIIPAGLIAYGVVTRGNKSLQTLDHSTSNEVNEHLKIPIPVDDYSQFAPALAVYGLDLAGIKAKHNFRDRTIVMASSYLIMGATVQTLKSSVNVWRPDGSNNHSFPSGHTATAFVGAHILFMEYKDTSPWIGIAGYTVATGTGVLRVLNKKHWVSDVVTGAGVGILSAELGYMLLPVANKVFGIKDMNKNLAIAPTIGTDNYGIGLVYKF